MLEAALAQWERIVVWGFLATAALTTILDGSHGIGFTRLSLPFLVGTLFTGVRRRASILGFLTYLLGGWAFAFLYFVVLNDIPVAHKAWLGGVLGLAHALFLLVVILPLLPHLHPRIASEYHGPSAVRRLEPPGFAGTNYGNRTPLTTLLGHAVYGIILGLGFSFAPVP